MGRHRKHPLPTITWLGGDDEPSANTWNGYTFKAGQPVEIKPDDAAYMLKKAKGNPFYEVSEPTAVPEYETGTVTTIMQNA